jgi:hypothetical protein
MADDSGEVVREAAESVAFANVKAAGICAEAASFYAAQAFAESLANTQAFNQVRLAAASRSVDQILGTTADMATDIAGAGAAQKGLVNIPPMGSGGA